LRNGKKATMVKIPVALLQRRNPWRAVTLTRPNPVKEAKPMKRVPLALAVPLMLVGCGQDGTADNNAAALERAAEQSTPEAADILRNAADGGGNVQEALQEAGNAQAASKAPPQQGAKPHAAGDPVPPPQIPAQGNSQ
jgi:ribosomal protein L12E/L44/L45/RPP1/RPP2